MKKSFDQMLTEYKAKKQAKAQREATRIKNAIAKAGKPTYKTETYDPSTYNNTPNTYPTFHKFPLQLIIVERKLQFEKGISRGHQIMIKDKYSGFLPYRVAEHIIRHYKLQTDKEYEAIKYYEPINCEIAISYKANTNHHILTIITDNDIQHYPIETKQATQYLMPTIEKTFHRTQDEILNSWY